MLQFLEAYRNRSARAIDSIPLEDVERLVNELATVKALAGRVFCIGNGGSQANVAHLVLHLREHGIMALDLLADNASVTAIANDFGYGQVASMQVRRFGIGANDMLLAISGKGESKNILHVMDDERAHNNSRPARWLIVGWEDSQTLGLASGKAVHLPVSEYGPFEDASAAVIHMINEGLRSLTD